MKIKRFISLILSVILIFTISLPVFAAEEPVDVQAESDSKSTTSVLGSLADGFSDALGNALSASAGKKFDAEKAVNAALAAAKSRFGTEGVSSDIVTKAVVSKMKYSKSAGSFDVTVRAGFVHKYTCTLTVKTFLGAEIGMPDDSEYTRQGIIPAIIGFGFEKVSYFFIRLIGADGPKA